jgi:nitrogen fixation/metabolism regulation signal transduction histidine kinase
LKPFRSIRVRIAAAFLAAILAMLGSLGFLVAQQAQVSDSLRLVANTYLPLSKLVAEIERDQQRVQRDLNRVNKSLPRPVVGGTSTAEIYTQELADNLAIARVILTGADSADVDPSETAQRAKMLAYLDGIEEEFKAYEQQSTEYLGLAARGADEVDVEPVRRRLRVTGKNLADTVEQLSLTLSRQIEARTKATEKQQQRATAVALGLALGTSLVTLVLILAVLYALRPITRLTEEVQRLAAGDLGGRVEVGGDDEVGVLAAEFNKMAAAIESRDRSLKERAEELNRLSRYLASVVDTLEEGLIVVENGLVTLTNPAARRVWGAEPEAAPPPGLVDALSAPTTARLAGPDDTVFVLRSARFGDHGIVAVISDVTEQVRAQERFARSERLALVGQMLAQITHEVRNPLNALSLNAELLGDEVQELDPEHRSEAWELLQLIAGEVERLTDVTGHYLQLARRPPARLRPTEIHRLVDEVVRLLEPELAAEGAVVQVVRAGPMVEQVDANQIRQALINVVRNAVEAGGKHLVLQIGREGREAWLELRDDGPGMAAAEVQRACDPFFSTKATGTGLGLAITRQILEDHDGQVQIASTAGEGTVVRLVWTSRPAEGEQGEPLLVDELLG